MAIISTETIRFEGNDYKKQIRCSSEGHFSIKLPPTVVKRLKIEEVAGDTLEEVSNAWKKITKEYKEAQTEDRKIIAYEIEINEGISFAHGMSLSVWASVFIEEKTNVPGKLPVYKYRDVDFEEMLPDELQYSGSFGVRDIEEKHIIDWTPERHEFFIAFHKAMSDLIKKVQTLNNKKKLLELADSGTKLLENI